LRSLNRVDKKGKKYGWQVDYLDASWKIVSKEKSYYFIYTFYDNGYSYDPLVSYIRNGTVNAEKNTKPSKIGEPVALNGQYTWCRNDGSLQSELQFKEGYRVGTHKAYKWGRVFIETNFDKKYDIYQDYSYYLIKYRKDGSITDKGYFRYGKLKDKNGYYIFLE
jgi:hypothetical protein